MNIFFLILGPTRQVHGSERTGFVCVSGRPFSALCKCACFCQATDGRKEETSKGHVSPPGSRAKMLGGLPVAHQGPCPPLPRPTLPLRLQGALLIKATWLTASSEEPLGRWIRSPEKPRTMQFVGQLALLPRLSEGRVTDRCGALAPGDGRGPQRDLQARPFLSLGGRMLGSD